MKPLMLITAPVATRSGYGSHSRDLVRGLISMDKFDIHINSMPWGNCPMNALNDKDPNDKVILDRIIQQQNLQRQPEIHIQISVPNEFTPLAKYNIGILICMCISGCLCRFCCCMILSNITLSFGSLSFNAFIGQLPHGIELMCISNLSIDMRPLTKSLL
jgi:hypothetical protein